MEEKLKEEIDNMDLPELLDFVGFRNSYKDMLESADELIIKAEARKDEEKEEEQLKRLEEENEYLSKN